MDKVELENMVCTFWVISWIASRDRKTNRKVDRERHRKVCVGKAETERNRFIEWHTGRRRETGKETEVER